MESIAKLVRNPLIILGPGGEILDMNQAARRSFGGERARSDEVFVDADSVRTLLWRASGSADPVLGALDMRTGAGERRRYRVVALALRSSEPPTFAIEIRQAEEDKFEALNEKLRELNLEIAQRQRAQAQLEEALAHNTLLYQELQHRVKNHLQMMLALVSAAGRESADPGHRRFVEMLRLKLSALFDAQRLMYAEQSADGVRADQMLNSIADTVQSLTMPQTIQVHAEPIVVPNDIAFPVALVANELLTNAAKHGGDEDDPRVLVSLRRSGAEAVLEVRDNGPGFTAPPVGRASSGLGLVRGLCRQIGGRLDISVQSGAVVTVSFPLPEELHAVC